MFENNINKYYFTITEDEFCYVEQNMDLCSFDEKEIAVIEPLIPNDRVIDKKTLGIKNLEFYAGRIPSNFKFDGYVKIDINFRGSKSNDFLSISKSNDEWYYVMYYFKLKTYKEVFFKCDQLGVIYPTDYGHINGYVGEDEDKLDIFVGSGNKFGYIKVYRLDVKSETKFLYNVSQEEIDSIIKAFEKVLISFKIFSKKIFLEKIEKFKL